MNHDDDDHFDYPANGSPEPVEFTRRRALRDFGLVTAGVAVAGLMTPALAEACVVEVPNETGGPYPGDGTNSNSSGVVNVLTQSGVVRSDIRSSFGSYSGTAAGQTTTLRITVENTTDCTPLVGAAVYVWHCTRDGLYSLYSSGATSQNYLRGVQITDENGLVEFTTIFPGCYSGRWPHIHFEVYPSQASITSHSNALKTSQFALPEATCRDVYPNVTGYSSSTTNLNNITLASDNIFSDGYSSQMMTASGSRAAGIVLTATVGVAGTSTGGGTKASSTTTLAGASSSTYGASVTWTATVASSGATPTGTVVLYAGSTAIAAGTLSDGVASIPVPAKLAAGSYALTAVYTGNSTTQSSTSSAKSLTVAKRPTTLTVAMVDGSVQYGARAYARIRLNPVAYGVAGSVRMYCDSALYKTVSVSASQANTLITVPLPNKARGKHTVRAIFVANTNFSASATPFVNYTVY